MFMRRNSTRSSREYDDKYGNDLFNEKGVNYDTASLSDAATLAGSATLHLESHNAQDLEKATNPYDPNRPKLGFRQRLQHFTWAWYTLPMSAGGLSQLILAQPFQFPGLKSIGLSVYIANLVIFTVITVLISARFILHQGTFISSIKHPLEGLYVPTFFLAAATVINSTSRYVFPEDDRALILIIQWSFWIYLVAASLSAIGQYSFLFAGPSYSLETMMPTWILPIFPVMFSGTIASVIAERQPQPEAMSIIVAGLACQGLGFSVAIMMLTHTVGRLMQTGLPSREVRPALFVLVGPPSFTSLVVTGLANSLPQTIKVAGQTVDVGLIRAMSVVTAVFLWALSIWWFGIAFVAVIQSLPKQFHLGWWSAIFPNTGFIMATISIGQGLGSRAVLAVTTGMSILLLVTFFVILYSNVRAFIVQDIMYPGRDEDI